MPQCRGHRPKGVHAAQRAVTQIPVHRLKSVYAARTIQVPQYEFESFLDDFSHHLGVVATMRNAASTHVTLLASAGVKEHFYERHYSARDLRKFARHMQAVIDKAGHNKPQLRARVDRNKPLGWFGCTDIDGSPVKDSDGNDLPSFCLAINLFKSERLKDQRGIIENTLEQEFGELPTMREFAPHVTIGSIRPAWREEYCQREAKNLLPKELTVPQSIALNGLAVYLDEIHLGYREDRRH